MCIIKFRLDLLALEFLEELNPLTDFAPKAVPSLDWVANGTEGAEPLLVLGQGRLLALAVDPVDGGL